MNLLKSIGNSRIIINNQDEQFLIASIRLEAVISVGQVSSHSAVCKPKAAYLLVSATTAKT